MTLKDKKLFLLDMDGTLYISDMLFDGVLEFLSYVKSRGGRCIYLTNNSSRGVEKYVERMVGFGIECGPEDFVTSADAAIKHLKENYGEQTLYYVCGTESLKAQLKGAGLRVARSIDENPEAVLLGYDTELDYKKIEDCCILLNRGADYIATHPDMVCPTWYGSAPDCGSFIEMFYTATGRRPIVIGKPQPHMAFLAMEIAGASPEQCCLIGDRVYTDIACGVNAGIDSILVLSGEGRAEDADRCGVKPSRIARDIREVLDDLKKENSHEA